MNDHVTFDLDAIKTQADLDNFLANHPSWYHNAFDCDAEIPIDFGHGNGPEDVDANILDECFDIVDKNYSWITPGTDEYLDKVETFYRIRRQRQLSQQGTGEKHEIRKDTKSHSNPTDRASTGQGSGSEFSWWVQFPA